MTSNLQITNNKKRITRNKLPENIINNVELNNAILNLLPQAYDFQVHKTIARIRELNARRVALQVPEGLILFADILSDIFCKFAYENDIVLDVLIMGDVAYGACCIDDFTSRRLKCDLLVHYGHSCLVPLPDTKTFYVLVTIKFDAKHFLDTLIANFETDKRLVLAGTVQFITVLQEISKELAKTFTVIIPRVYPLSNGEVLGCTAPTVADGDILIYVGDGRFHLEALMIANPKLPAYKYDPYTKKITIEEYDHTLMRKNRFDAIKKARTATKFGVIKGTLGRQGSSPVLEAVIKAIKMRGFEYEVILLSEVFPSKLAMFDGAMDAFIQISCPRLSIDWGTYFTKPLLTPYEAAVCLDMVDWMPQGHYPMDFYAYESLGDWTPNHNPTWTKKRKHIVIGGDNTEAVAKPLIQVPYVIESACHTTHHCHEHGIDQCTNCTCMFNE